MAGDVASDAALLRFTSVVPAAVMQLLATLAASADAVQFDSVVRFVAAGTVLAPVCVAAEVQVEGTWLATTVLVSMIDKSNVIAPPVDFCTAHTLCGDYIIIQKTPIIDPSI